MRKHITDHAKCITERFRFGQLCELIIDMRLYAKALHAVISFYYSPTSSFKQCENYMLLSVPFSSEVNQYLFSQSTHNYVSCKE